MTIEDMIKKLQEIQQEYGNLEVFSRNRWGMLRSDVEVMPYVEYSGVVIHSGDEDYEV